MAACSKSSPETATERGRPAEAKSESSTRGAESAEEKTRASESSGARPASIHVDAEILGKKVQVELPYTKELTYLESIEGHALFQEAFRVKAPAVLSTDASVAERLAKIDQLREETHEAYRKTGGKPFDPAISGFDAALADLLLAYFDMAKDAILKSDLSIERKRAALAEFNLESVDVLRWAPIAKHSISFYDTEAELALDSWQ